MKEAEYYEHWLQAHPATRVNHHLRELLAHYIGFFPEGALPELAALVLDITALMELVDALAERHPIEQGGCMNR